MALRNQLSMMLYNQLFMVTQIASRLWDVNIPNKSTNAFKIVYKFWLIRN